MGSQLIHKKPAFKGEEKAVVQSRKTSALCSGLE